MTEHRVQELARGSGGDGCGLTVLIGATVVAGWSFVFSYVWPKLHQYAITAGDKAWMVVAGLVGFVICLAFPVLGIWAWLALGEASTLRWRNSQPDLAQYVLYGAALKSHETSVSEAQRQHKQAMEQFELALREWKLTQLSWWLQLDGPQFERAVGEVLTKIGCRVQSMGGSGDRGVDLLIEKPDGRNVIVQCKAHKAPIGPGTVRDLYGALIHSGLPEGWVISTSNFTGGAQDFASGKPIRLIHIQELVPLEILRRLGYHISSSAVFPHRGSLRVFVWKEGLRVDVEIGRELWDLAEGALTLQEILMRREAEGRGAPDEAK